MASPETSTSSTEPFLHMDLNSESATYTTLNTSLDDVTAADECDEAPPPYTAEPNWRLTYVDFTPKCVAVGGILSSARFEPFEMLVARANSYLLRHPDTCIKCLETTKFTVSSISCLGVTVDPRVPTLEQRARSTGYVVQGLRMWIIPRQHEQQPSATQVGYINVVPACLHPGGIFKTPVFDNLSETVKKLNALLETKPLPGRILNIESVRTPFRQHSTWIEPNRCHWRQGYDISTSFMTFTRVYYEACDSPHSEHIGYKDFVPQEMSKTHRLLHPTEKYESMHDLSEHASTWLQQQHDVTLINIETTYHISKKEGKKTIANTEKSLCLQSSACKLQCLRVWFTDQHETGEHFQRPRRLQCRMFCPEQLVSSGMFSSPIFENMMQTRQRLKNWALTYSDISIVCAETVYLKLHSAVPEELWSAITHHRGNLDYHCLSISVLRLYVWCEEELQYNCSPPGVSTDSYQNMAVQDRSESGELNTMV